MTPRELEPGERAELVISVANEHSSRLREVVVDVAGARVQRPADLPPGGSETVGVSVRAPQEGALAVRVEQRFADGSSERQTVEVPVREPDPPMQLGRALVAGLSGLLALGVALAFVSRRRSKLSES